MRKTAVRSSILVAAVAIASVTTGNAFADSAASDHAVVEALMRLPQDGLSSHPEHRKAVLRYLKRKSGTSDYIRVARELQVFEQTDELVKMVTATPFDNTLAVDAAQLLVQSKQLAAIEAVLVGAESDAAVSAATALGYVNNPAARNLLEAILEKPEGNPQIRIAAVAALGKSDAGARDLLRIAEAGSIGQDVKFAFSDALLGSGNPEIREAAKKYVTPVAAVDSKTIPPVKSLVSMRGDGEKGKVVFHTVGTCIKCHKVQGEGKEVGPDLSEIGSKLSRQDMYVAILNPSAAVSHNYEMYSVLSVDGQVTTGLLMNRNAESITIRNQEGIDREFALEDVEELKQQTASLMPSDLQKAMSLKNLVDLVDYLVLLKKPGEKPFQVLAGESAAPNRHDPNSAVGGFEIADGIEVELFASEPMLLSPTSIDVDSLGRVWVCEAVNYRHFRNPDNPQRSEGDRILVLEDTDGDGRADKRTVFYQGTDIDSPHGVTVLGDRVLVSAGENVIAFIDADGDLSPESKSLMFTGISGVQHDHGIHAFGIGPDGKLYFNFGNAGKQLKNSAGETIVDKAGNVVDDSRNPYQEGMVFRCNLDGSELETLGWNFRNNWEVCVDSFGSMWQSDNDDDGNRGTRINFVMEFGNYGYKDELTGDAWRAQRIGLESEIPLQHWHLNDPGVVPNILQTGAGSPTGIFLYEGELLPEPFQNQIIHTDPGPNVVRAYPVENDGAGYKASIRNLVKGVRDRWFRPVDVCAAPDGSLLVADWYDPGVGGHRMGDTQHGRIFRVVPTGHDGYRSPKYDYSSAKGAVAALTNPNMATRFLAQQAIQKMGSESIAALERLSRNTSNPRMKARALWQLGLVGANVEKYIEQAVNSEDPNLRILGVRLARQHNADVAGVVERLKNDSSSHVRRELAIAIRHMKDPRATELWVDLAVQHDGKDRWYIEALGIAADRQWDQCLDAWLSRVGDDWNTPGGRDIVWRCRSPKACDYLAEIIKQAASEQEQYRYFRALDFQTGEAKQAALLSLVTGEN